jgi:hypothetical protein
VVTACWSVKGGAGTTVVAASLGILRAHRSSAGCLLADLAGDLPATLGLPPSAGGPPGLAGWLAAAPDVLPDALARLEVVVAEGIALLPRGPGGLAPAGSELLAAVLAGDHRDVVVDCGRLSEDEPGARAVAVTDAILTGAARSLLVLRPCYVSVRRARAARHRPSGIVLVTDESQAIRGRDVESVLGVPVVATVRISAAVARAVDAGLLATSLPRGLARDLRRVA